MNKFMPKHGSGKELIMFLNFNLRVKGFLCEVAFRENERK